MEIAKANVADPPDIVALVNAYAAQGLMLPRALSNVYECLRDFFVCRNDGVLVACAALHVVWEDLGEVRSLAVGEEHKGSGIGRQLVLKCLEEARQLGMRRVFTLTYVPEFFQKLGFRLYPKEKLPHKVWADCLNCPKFPDCDEICLLTDLEEAAPPAA